MGGGDLPQPSSVAFSGDGKILAVGGESSVGLLDVAKDKKLHLVGGHQETVSLVQFSPDAKTILSQSEDETVREWDAKTGKEIRRIASMEGNRTFPVFSRDGRIAAALVPLNNKWLAPPVGIRVWNTATGKDIRLISIEKEGYDDPSFLALSPDGKWLALHKKFFAQDGPNRQLGQQHQTWLYDLTKNSKDPNSVIVCENVANPQQYRSRPTGIMFSPDSQLLAVPFNDNVLRLWDVATGKQRCQIVRSIRSMAFAPNGQSLALDSGDQPLSIWEVATGKVRCHMNKKPLPAGTPEISSFMCPFFFRPCPTVSQLAFSPNGAVLFEGHADGMIGVWDVVTGEEIGVLRGHQGPVQTVALAPDGKTLASGSMDSTVLLWDMTRWTQRKRAPARDLSDRDLKDIWKDLLGSDAAQAFKSLVTMAAAPRQAVPFLQKHLQPLPAADAQRIQRLINDLDSNKFAVRQKAGAALEQEGELALPQLRQALKDKKLSLEANRRLQQIIVKVSSFVVYGERLRQVRAVEALERMATPEAKQLLQTLAQGMPEALLTREAQAAWKRLGR